MDGVRLLIAFREHARCIEGNHEPANSLPEEVQRAASMKPRVPSALVRAEAMISTEDNDLFIHLQAGALPCEGRQVHYDFAERITVGIQGERLESELKNVQPWKVDPDIFIKVLMVKAAKKS